jgi:hypothetical protein
LFEFLKYFTIRYKDSIRELFPLLKTLPFFS